MRFSSKLAIVFSAVFILNVYTTDSCAYNKQLFQQANQFWAEKSYQFAIQNYRNLLKDIDLPEERLREVNFKLADSLWRSGGDVQKREAENILKGLIKVRDDTDEDRWWAEANQSLAEMYLSKDRWSHQNEVQKQFEAARNYWVGATDLKLARKRFIEVSFLYGDHLSQNRGWYFSGYSCHLKVQVENR